MKNCLNSGKPGTGNAVGNPERSPLKGNVQRLNGRPQAGSKQAAPRKGEDIVRSASKGAAAKWCRVCKKVKSLDKFYPYSGRLCKECVKVLVKEYRRSDKYKAYAKEQRVFYKKQFPQRWAESRKKYKHTEKGKVSERRYRKSLYGRLPEKLRARGLVNTHIRRGKIKKPICCGRCGRKTSLQAHHPDYSKPLEIRWLCLRCHKLADSEVAF